MAAHNALEVVIEFGARLGDRFEVAVFERRPEWWLVARLFAFLTFLVEFVFGQRDGYLESIADLAVVSRLAVFPVVSGKRFNL